MQNGLNPYKWRTLRYHPVQAKLWAEMWNPTTRFICVVAGRRSGKTDLCKRRAVLSLVKKKPWPDPLYYIVAPTREQVKRLYWDDLNYMIPKEWLIKNGANKSELSFTTKYGSKLYLVGADKPHRLEGVGADGVIVDESSDQKPGLFGLTIVPLLADKKGWCYRIGVPKRFGIGKEEFRTFYDRGLTGVDGVQSFFWKSSEVIPADEIALLKDQMDEVDFEEQFEAQWKDIGGSVYHAFHSNNITYENTQYSPLYPIHVGCDFNVDPMCWTLSHYVDGKLYVFDEIFLRNTNTQRTLDHVKTKYRDHIAGWNFYGDASSRARKTSSTMSDFLIIRNDARFGEGRVFFPPKNPHIRDRVATVNRALKSASGVIRIFINPQCKRLINDLNSVSYQEGTSELQDYSGTDIGHMVDALGYKVFRLMPIRLRREAAPEVHSMAG